MSKQRFNSRQLSQHLREIAAEATTTNDEGDLVTNGERLARLLWERALGFTEKKIVENKDGTAKETEIVHPPEAWAMQLVYDRLEGKTPQAIADDSGRITAAQRVSDLNKSRLNQMATAATAPKMQIAGRIPLPPKPLPPKLPKKQPPKDETNGDQP